MLKFNNFFKNFKFLINPLTFEEGFLLLILFWPNRFFLHLYTLKKLILLLSEIFSFLGPIAGRYYRFKNSDGDPISGGLKQKKDPKRDL